MAERDGQICQSILRFIGHKNYGKRDGKICQSILRFIGHKNYGKKRRKNLPNQVKSVATIGSKIRLTF
jgi:hypothetical protein